MPAHATPLITALRVVPVAGRDSMLLNLSGAHGPFFTHNLLILTDSGHTGVGEVPGGEAESLESLFLDRVEHVARSHELRQQNDVHLAGHRLPDRGQRRALIGCGFTDTRLELMTFDQGHTVDSAPDPTPMPLATKGK